MDETLTRVWNQLLARPTGPLQFRFVLQPILAVIIAIHAGVKDARAQEVPYLSGFWHERAKRRSLLRSALKDVGRLFIMAVAMDCVYQSMEIHWIHPLQALLVGFVLAIVPYVLIRGPVTRIVSRGIARRHLR